MPLLSYDSWFLLLQPASDIKYLQERVGRLFYFGIECFKISGNKNLKIINHNGWLNFI